MTNYSVGSCETKSFHALYAIHCQWGTNCGDIWIDILDVNSRQCIWKMPAPKVRPFCCCLNVVRKLWPYCRMYSRIHSRWSDAEEYWSNKKVRSKFCSLKHHSCHKTKQVLVWYETQVIIEIVHGYRNWPRYGLRWSGWYCNPAQHELCRPSCGRTGRHNECCAGLQYQPLQRRPYK